MGHRFLQRLKIACSIIVPSLIPRRPGDRIKTDRRDALALARLLRSGELTATWVPDEQHEALRDLVRAREDCVEDQLRARHRVGKFLLRNGLTPPAGVRAWSVRNRQWLDGLRWQDRAQELVFNEYRHPRGDRAAYRAPGERAGGTSAKARRMPKPSRHCKRCAESSSLLR